VLPVKLGKEQLGGPGRWPTHVLDATPTFLIEANQQDLYAYRAAEALKMNPTLTSTAAPTSIKAAGGAPTLTAAPPPPSFNTLVSSGDWVQWDTTPRWDVPFRKQVGQDTNARSALSLSSTFI